MILRIDDPLYDDGLAVYGVSTIRELADNVAPKCFTGMFTLTTKHGVFRLYERGKESIDADLFRTELAKIGDLSLTSSGVVAININEFEKECEIIIDM